ncbi:M48 family metallopeptidase [uncultured Reyranella sp.]|uniref:M48 family metallopeptidase n=1 Tax=uncultured Reyranella sp. TaxID=735512 RepID=UPI0025CC3B90|nr:M48 family metallopeptidase [uncultured Reyranella sp.]
MHPILRFLLVACGFVSLLAACETAPVSGRSQVMLVSENEEREMGLQAYREVLNKEPLSRDAQVNAMVDKVGRRIANAAEHPPQELWRAPRFRWEFKTVDKNEPNAFCLPGGKVVVYTGLLPITKTETGMAVVVAHEVAHALARHGAERMSDQMVASVGTAAAAVALSATVSGRSRTYLPAMMAAVGAGATVGYILPMSRAQESEADRIGLVLMAMAGYDPREAVALWERMRAASSGKRQAEWLSTHPADTTRIADIRRWLPEAMQYYKPR